MEMGERHACEIRKYMTWFHPPWYSRCYTLRGKKISWKWRENVKVTGIRDKDKKTWRKEQNKVKNGGRSKIK
jgi:hypothetical protein